jgi:chemotaxis protein MotB
VRPKKPEKEPNHERWLVSYGDLLTLLFAVFVTLYAMSQADKKKAEEVAQSVREAFGTVSVSNGASPRPAVISTGQPAVIAELHGRQAQPPTGLPAAKSGRDEAGFQALKASLEAYFLKIGAGDKVAIAINERGLVITLREAGFFESGSATLKGGSSEVIEAIADGVNHLSNRLSVEGHTDDQPVHGGQFRSNWDLSTARATCLVKQLVARYGVSPERISATGYAQFQPQGDNATPEGRARNRRVDIVVLATKGDEGVSSP